MLFLKVFCFFEGMIVDLLVVLRRGPTSNANLDEIGFSSSFTIFLSKLIHFLRNLAFVVKLTNLFSYNFQ